MEKVSELTKARFEDLFAYHDVGTLILQRCFDRERTVVHLERTSRALYQKMYEQPVWESMLESIGFFRAPGTQEAGATVMDKSRFIRHVRLLQLPQVFRGLRLCNLLP